MKKKDRTKMSNYDPAELQRVIDEARTYMSQRTMTEGLTTEHARAVVIVSDAVLALEAAQREIEVLGLIVQRSAIFCVTPRKPCPKHEDCRECLRNWAEAEVEKRRGEKS